jgi:hypothetical protein
MFFYLQFAPLMGESDVCSGTPRTFFFLGWGGRGGSTNSVEERGQRERGCGGSKPLVRGSIQFTRILIRLLQMYVPWNREFSSALSKPPPPLVCHWMCVLRFDATHIRVCIVTFQANVSIVTAAKTLCMTPSDILAARYLYC